MKKRKTQRQRDLEKVAAIAESEPWGPYDFFTDHIGYDVAEAAARLLNEIAAEVRREAKR